jgi:hypothetical protein
MSKYGEAWAPAGPGGVEYELSVEPAPPGPEALEKAMRSTKVPKSKPEIEAEIKKFGEENIAGANRAQYNKWLEAARSRGIWYGAVLPWLGVFKELANAHIGNAATHAIGAGMTSLVTVVSLTKLADVLERPEIRDWIAKPSVAEIRELDKLPPEMRAEVSEGLRKVNIVAKKNGYRFSPMLVAYMAANRGAAKKQDEEQK